MSEDYPPSPVPGDQDLWPGEPPFTHWGQHPYGTLDLRVFDQGVWWVDIHQRPHRTGTEMDAAYIRNVIGFLHRHRDYYYRCTLRRSLIQMIDDVLLGLPNADVLAEQAGVPALSELTPAEWLEATPLMKALRARTR